VFIVIQKLLGSDIMFYVELQYLLRAIQTRLCTVSVYDSDKGRFIRLTIVFSRICLVVYPTEDCYLTISNVLKLEEKL